MRRDDFRKLLLRTIAVPIVALALLASLLVLQISYLINTLQWVDHTDRAIAAGRNITRLALEMESGLRGYLLTGYTTFLAPYDSAKTEIGPTLEQLLQLTHDNPDQVRRVRELQQNFRDWQQYSERMIAARQQSQRWDDPDLNLEGRRLMQQVRRVREDFIREEERLRDQRGRRARLATIVTFALSGLASATVGLVIVLNTRRQMIALNQTYDAAMQAEIRAVNELHKTEQRLATTLRSIGDGVITTDARGTIEFLNSVAEQITGYKLEEVRGKKATEILRIVDDRTHEAVTDIIAAIDRRGAIAEPGDHSLLVTRSGAELPIEHSGAPIVESNGISTGLVFVFRDVSQRRRTEEALRASEKLALIGRLSATIAHEIRNPLDAVSNVLYLLKSSPEATPQTRDSVAMGEQEVARMGQIAGQLLNYSRESSAPVPVMITDIMQGTVSLFTPKLRAEHIHLRASYTSKLQVLAVPGELRQVFSNVLSNAIEAAGREGSIHVRVRDISRRQNSRASVAVLICDNGPGIPIEVQGKVFTPFFSTKGEQGTGLGLWLSRSLVEKHRGSIRFRSSRRPQSRGTCFVITIPETGNQNSSTVQAD